MKWHSGLPDDWADLPDPTRGKREFPPRPDVDDDQELKTSETSGVLIVRREGSSRAYVAGDYVDLDAVR